MLIIATSETVNEESVDIADDRKLDKLIIVEALLDEIRYIYELIVDIELTRSRFTLKYVVLICTPITVLKEDASTEIVELNVETEEATTASVVEMV